jgi:hypothetical protein
MKTEEQEKAILAAETAVKDVPKDSEAYIELGMTLFPLGAIQGCPGCFSAGHFHRPKCCPRL